MHRLRSYASHNLESCSRSLLHRPQPNHGVHPTAAKARRRVMPESLPSLLSRNRKPFLGIPSIHPFDDTVILCRKLISAPRLTLGGRSGRRNSLSNQRLLQRVPCTVRLRGLESVRWWRI